MLNGNIVNLETMPLFKGPRIQSIENERAIIVIDKTERYKISLDAVKNR